LAIRRWVSSSGNLSVAADLLRITRPSLYMLRISKAALRRRLRELGFD
jgi:hypothetical protein